MTKTIFAALLSALLLSGCGLLNAWDGEDDIYGAHLWVRIQDPVLAARYSSSDPAFRKQLHDAIEMAAAYNHMSPYAVSGWRIILQDWSVGHDGWTGGDTDSTNQNITIDVLAGFGCDIFHSVLAHEMLHVRKYNPPFEWGNPSHSDSEWHSCDWNGLWWMANEATVESNLMVNYETWKFPEPWCRRDQPWIGQWRGDGTQQGACSGEKP